MKIIIIGLLSLLFFLPLVLSAQESFPSFPMAFYGTAQLNGTGLPSGTKIQAYNNGLLKGEVTIDKDGIYGYDNPVKNKLIVSEYQSGDLLFKYIIPGSQEALTGDNIIKYQDGFIAGKTLLFNLNFIKKSTPTVSPPPTQTGGGGGGGGGYYSAPFTPTLTPTPIPTLTPTPTFSPTPTPEPLIGEVLGVSKFNFIQNMGKGMRGKAVTELQKRLSEEGVYSGPITGYFGPLTEAAVKEYQKRFGIIQTGFVGPLTRAKLNDGQASAAKITTSASPSVEELKIKINQLQAQLLVLLQQLIEALKAQKK